MNADDLIKRTHVGKQNDAYWLTLEKDILEFLKSDSPEDEKERFRRKGRGEMVYMLCEAIRGINRATHE